MVHYWLGSKCVEGAKHAIGPREGEGGLWLVTGQAGSRPKPLHFFRPGHDYSYLLAFQPIGKADEAEFLQT